MDNVPDLIGMIDRSFRVVYLNRPFLGREPDELVGARIEDLVPDSLDEGSAGRLADVIEHRRSYVRDFRLTTPEGERICTAHVGPIVRDGEVDGIVIVVRDVTEQRRAEERQRLFEERVQATRRLESLGLLAGGVAHDFNNLLMGMMAHAGLALDEIPEDSPAHERLLRIEAAAARAGELVEQLLTCSGRGRIEVRSLDLGEIVAEMEAVMRPLIPPHVDLQLEVDQDLPTVEADGTQMRQLTLNLLTNAVQSIGERKGAIRVRVGAQRCAPGTEPEPLPGGLHASLVVEDTGCGIDAATQARMFDPFFTTRPGGRGLGLATVMGIVRGHHGRVDVASTPGVGTVFRVLIPVHPPRDG